MSDTFAARPASADADRAVAILVYVLYFATPFLPVVSALVGVVLAYVRLKGAGPTERSHYAFQIRAFWIALALFVLATVAVMLGGGVLIAHLFRLALAHGDGWDAWDATFGDGSNGRLNLAGLIVLGMGGLILAADVLWLMLAAVFGFARLVGGEGVGGSRP